MKLFNFRLPAAIALSLAAGVVFGTVTAYFGGDIVYVLIPFAISAAVLGLCIIKYKSPSLAVKLFLVIVFFLVGSLYVYFYLCSYAASEVPLYQTCCIAGKVDKVGMASSGRTYLVLSDVTADGVKLNGKVIAYLGVNAGEYCEAGYRVTFFAPLRKESLFSDGEISYQLQNGVKYFCTVSEGMKSTWRFSLFGTVNGAIRKTLFSNLDSETAAVCLAMLTGDSSLISQGTLSSFRNGGIAHLFAVSGLHIGVIFGALTLLFKKLPVNRFVSAAVSMAIIIFYAGVCGFTPSSVRAAVTCSVFVISSLLHKKYDAVNSLSLVAVILMLINPLCIYGAGFLLSFGAALGILTLNRSISKAFGFLPKKLRKPLSVALSAQITTIPTQFFCFGYVTWAGLLLNVIVVPVVTVFYLLLVICTALAVILPFAAGGLITFAATPVQLMINSVVECGFENAVISRSFGVWIYLPFVLASIGISDYFNLRPLCRSTLCSAAVVLLTIAFLI